ncbi:MAG TPA: protein translocase subunit SecF [Gemmatimonadota bacterium]
MLRFFKNPKIPFIEWRHYAYILSLLLLVPGTASLLLKGGPRYGIDFTGGTLVQLRFEREVPLDKLRGRLADVELGTFELERFGDPREVVIRAKEQAGRASELAQRIEAAIRQDPELASNEFEVVRVDAVGPKIGSELQRKAILAIVYSWLFINLYVYFRFKGFKYGVTTVIALIHDSLVVIGVFSLLDKEITLDVIAAILTIIGYSVMDSIVVLDRIREKMRSRTRASLVETIDRAINETLSRTVITSGLTLLVVLSLLFFGGRVIHDFAFALLVGIVAGSYSSIFVVAPLLVEWEAFMRKRRGGGGEVDSKGVASPAPATPDGVSSSTEREKSPQPAGRASRAQRRSRSRRGR